MSFLRAFVFCHLLRSVNAVILFCEDLIECLPFIFRNCTIKGVPIRQWISSISFFFFFTLVLYHFSTHHLLTNKTKREIRTNAISQKGNKNEKWRIVPVVSILHFVVWDRFVQFFWLCAFAFLHYCAILFHFLSFFFFFFSFFRSFLLFLFFIFFFFFLDMNKRKSCFRFQNVRLAPA